ncbi:MAG: putative membrane protein [Crocinitomix sp.]|jgi:uncharacterized membrane protein
MNNLSQIGETNLRQMYVLNLISNLDEGYTAVKEVDLYKNILNINYIKLKVCFNGVLERTR